MRQRYPLTTLGDRAAVDDEVRAFGDEGERGDYSERQNVELAHLYGGDALVEIRYLFYLDIEPLVFVVSHLVREHHHRRLDAVAGIADREFLGGICAACLDERRKSENKCQIKKFLHYLATSFLSS